MPSRSEPLCAAQLFNVSTKLICKLNPCKNRHGTTQFRSYQTIKSSFEQRRNKVPTCRSRCCNSLAASPITTSNSFLCQKPLKLPNKTDPKKLKKECERNTTDRKSKNDQKQPGLPVARDMRSKLTACGCTGGRRVGD